MLWGLQEKVCAPLVQPLAPRALAPGLCLGRGDRVGLPARAALALVFRRRSLPLRRLRAAAAHRAQPLLLRAQVLQKKGDCIVRTAN
jgi:hypothetical protein